MSFSFDQPKNRRSGKKRYGNRNKNYDKPIPMNDEDVGVLVTSTTAPPIQLSADSALAVNNIHTPVSLSSNKKKKNPRKKESKKDTRIPRKESNGSLSTGVLANLVPSLRGSQKQSRVGRNHSTRNNDEGGVLGTLARDSSSPLRRRINRVQTVAQEKFRNAGNAIHSSLFGTASTETARSKRAAAATRESQETEQQSLPSTTHFTAPLDNDDSDIEVVDPPVDTHTAVESTRSTSRNNNASNRTETSRRSTSTATNASHHHGYPPNDLDSDKFLDAILTNSRPGPEESSPLPHPGQHAWSGVASESPTREKPTKKIPTKMPELLNLGTPHDQKKIYVASPNSSPASNTVATHGSVGGFRIKKTNGRKKSPGKPIVPGAAIRSRRPEELDPIEDFDSSQENHQLGLGGSLLTGRNRRSPDNDKYGRARKRTRRSSGVNPKGFHDKKSKTDLNDNREYTLSPATVSRTPVASTVTVRQTRSKTKKEKDAEVVDLCSDSDSEMVLSALAESPSVGTMQSTPEQVRRGGMRSARRANMIEELNVVRIAIGRKVYASNCRVQYEAQNENKVLSLFYNKRSKGSRSNKDRDNAKHEIWAHEEINEMKYYLVGDDKEPNAETEKNNSSFDESEQMTFLAMRISPNKDNGLKQLTNLYLQSEKWESSPDVTKKYIVIEFRSDKDLIKLLEIFRRDDHLHIYAEHEGLFPSDVPNYAAALVEESKNEKKRREDSIGSPRRRSKRLGTAVGKSVEEDNKLVLVYPFGVSDEVVDNATRGVTIADEDREETYGTNPVEGGPQPYSDGEDLDGNADVPDNNGEPKTSGRIHALTIRSEDRARLQPGEFLNDTLIDFWMQWIWRKEKRAVGVQSNVHFFTSHFFTTLLEDGVDAVESWTARKGINVFSKKFVFIPINKSLHWSLCVVVNPHAILNSSRKEGTGPVEEDLLPCILFFDSLKAHRKNLVANKVRRWLNSEWKRLENESLGKAPFTKDTMPVFDPQVPYQDNSWDCGVFVCRYAYGLYSMRDRDFTFGDSHEMKAFSAAITQSDLFDFGMPEIAELRENLGVLVDTLSGLYLPWKTQQDLEEKKAKAARKKRREEEARDAKATSKPKAEKEDDSKENNSANSQPIPSDPLSGVDKQALATAQTEKEEEKMERKLDFEPENEQTQVRSAVEQTHNIDEGDKKTKVTEQPVDDVPAINEAAI